MKAIRKVLFPTKFEALSLPCVERLYPLKAAGLEEILFLFVIDREEVAFDLFRGFDTKLANELREEANLRFEDWGREVEKHGFRTRHFVEVGRPEGKILEVACREEVDLIVSGRQKHLPGDTVYLGGTAMGVLRRSAIPVLVCKHGPPGSEPPPSPQERVFDRVLFATDFSEDSLCALEMIQALNGATRRVDVVHVITEREFRKHKPEELRAEETECRDQMERICQELRAAGFEAEHHLFAGNPVTEVLRAAVDCRSSMIAMGTKGKHGVKEIWLGSVSHRVAEVSPVSVLLVPRERAECYV